MRLGVGAALVDGRLLPGDVEVDRRRGHGGRPERRPGAWPRGARVRRSPGQRVRGRGSDDRRSSGLRPTSATPCSRPARRPSSRPSSPRPRRRADRRAARAAARRHSGGSGGGSPGGIGPRVLGAHLEGPFLSPLRAGAHDVSALAARRSWRSCGGCWTRGRCPRSRWRRSYRARRAGRRAGRARRDGVRGPHRCHRRRGARRVRPRRADRHAPVQRDAPEHRARSRASRGRRSRARA